MPLSKVNVGTNEDGSPRYHFTHDGDENEAVIYTGPHISGQVTLPDGSQVDVTDHYIAVPKKQHDAVVNAIGDHHEKHGHPLHRAEAPFKHIPLKTKKG